MERLAQRARELLETNLIPFWLGLKDEKYGGFYGYVDYDLNVSRTAEKGCILNSRILWFFSECAMEFDRPELRRAAEHAYRFLRERCLDKAYGGVYWSIDYRGVPLDRTKHTYNQAFAIYGLSSYYRMSGGRDALNLAMELFQTIEERCTDEGGYLEAFTENWRPERNEKLSENGVLADRTMNTLLHIFEGYAGLYLAGRDEAVGAAMRRILDLYAERIFDPGRASLRVFLDLDYRSLLDLYSYGHDIEASWLVDWGTGLLGDADLSEKISHIHSVLAENALRNGFTGRTLATERENGKLDPWRVWWVQAEAVTGFLSEWQKHPAKREYLSAAVEIFRTIQTTFVDPRPGGEWFWRVDADGVPDETKPIVEPWKCPYHNGRMCLELIRRNPDAEA